MLISNYEFGDNSLLFPDRHTIVIEKGTSEKKRNEKNVVSNNVISRVYCNKFLSNVVLAYSTEMLRHNSYRDLDIYTPVCFSFCNTVQFTYIAILYTCTGINISLF